LQGFILSSALSHETAIRGRALQGNNTILIFKNIFSKIYGKIGAGQETAAS